MARNWKLIELSVAELHKQTEVEYLNELLPSLKHKC